jgi:flagellar assembly protein FliH
MSKLTPGPESEVERWYFTPFDDPHAQDFTPPTVDEIAAIEAAAREDGFRQGFQEGFADGQQKLQVIDQVLNSFTVELHRLNEAVGLHTTTLAIEIARKVVTVAFTLDETCIARVAEQALQRLPPHLEPTRILLNPEDRRLLMDLLGPESSGRKLTYLSDPSISRGGCKLATATSDIDATLETRWRRVTEVLQGHPWVPIQNTSKSSTPVGENAQDD